jgi:hypothetical protein
LDEKGIELVGVLAVECSDERFEGLDGSLWLSVIEEALTELSPRARRNGAV